MLRLGAAFVVALLLSTEFLAQPFIWRYFASDEILSGWLLVLRDRLLIAVAIALSLSLLDAVAGPHWTFGSGLVALAIVDVVRPESGVFYPTGLVEGQRVQVEFRRANPDLVRVSGRSWTVAVVPALSIPLVGVPLAALVYAAASPRGHRWPPRIPRGVTRRSPARVPGGAQ